MLLPISSLVTMLACADVGDTSYGRLDGDVALAFSAGAAASARGVSGALDLRFRYLQTAGLFATYEEGFGAGAEPLRVLTGGIELRPLFLGRFFEGLELGSPYADLLIDSLAFDVGAFVAQPTGGPFADVAGLSFGVGLELPWLGKASSPFVGVRAAVRWSREALSAADPTTVDVLGFAVTLVIGYQGLFGAHVVDVGDTRR
ncbi:MAG TPA: hypothetical protein VLM85_12140 [Polyangiaceae bacterium]|nr:hypothetical protein [Polyangiaceae bacterium]